MILIYMAHPVRPLPGSEETVESNLERARLWLRWCHERFPAWVVIAPWIVECEIYDDSDEAQRAASMARVLEAVRRCDGVLLVSDRVSRGMRDEARASLIARGSVFDTTWAKRKDPPMHGIEPVPLLARDGYWPGVLR